MVLNIDGDIDYIEEQTTFQESHLQRFSAGAWREKDV